MERNSNGSDIEPQLHHNISEGSLIDNILPDADDISSEEDLEAKMNYKNAAYW